VSVADLNKEQENAIPPFNPPFIFLGIGSPPELRTLTIPATACLLALSLVAFKICYASSIFRRDAKNAARDGSPLTRKFLKAFSLCCQKADYRAPWAAEKTPRFPLLQGFPTESLPHPYSSVCKIHLPLFSSSNKESKQAAFLKNILEN